MLHNSKTSILNRVIYSQAALLQKLVIDIKA